MIKDVLRNKGDDHVTDDDKVEDLLREARMQGLVSSGFSVGDGNIFYRVLSLVACLIIFLL